MTPQDFIYQEAYRRFSKLGFKSDNCEAVARMAVDYWKKDNTAKVSVDKAVKEGKKIYKAFK